MAISVGMGECPASPYLSLSLLSIPPSQLSPSPFLCPLTPALLAPYNPAPSTSPPPTASSSLSKDLQATVPFLTSPSVSSSSTPSFSLRGCSSRCTLTARGYCEWKCSCWTRRPLQSTGQRLVYLCLRLTTFDLQLALHTCHRG